MKSSLFIGRKQKIAGISLLLLFSAWILCFCSRSGPFWPINDWCDANVYLTIGRGMNHGKVVYRDLYDHKGPLLYFLHMPCALIQNDGFFGVYLLEMICCAVFLYYSARILRLLGTKNTLWMMTVLLGICVYCSSSFCQGDSAEELCMPLISISLYKTLHHLKNEQTPSATQWILQGFLIGCTFWTKFSVIGIQCGCILTLLFSALSSEKKHFRYLLQSILFLIVGFGFSTLPWFIYFGVNGAVTDWLKVYFYDNLFLYDGSKASLPSTLKAMASCCAEWMVQNPGYSVLILLGLASPFIFRIRKLSLCVYFSLVIGLLGTFWGGKEYPYYGHALVCMSVFGIAVAAHAVEVLLGRLNTRFRRIIPLFTIVLCICLVPLISPNMRADYGYSFGEQKNKTMQYRFAEIMKETPDATCLNFGFIDAGFLNAAGLVPSVKYFHFCNVPLTEMKTEQARYVKEGLTDYVITRGLGCEGLDENYELIDTCPSPNFWYSDVYLYRRMGIE